MAENKKMLRPSEVCEQLNITNETMHTMIADGRLVATKLGPRTTRIYADSVDELIERGHADA